jgi:surface protein
LVVFLAIVVLVLPTTSVKVFAATVIPTLECFPPRLGADMSYMLHAATVFNQNIGGWDVSKVTDMSYSTVHII